jgi:hypothetical protein
MLRIHPGITYVCISVGYSVLTDSIGTVSLCFYQLKSTHRNWHPDVWFAILWRSSEAGQCGSCGTVKPFNSIGWHHSSKAIAVELIKLLWGEAWSFAHFNDKGNDIYIVVKPWLTLLFKSSRRFFRYNGMLFRHILKLNTTIVIMPYCSIGWHHLGRNGIFF